MNQRPTPGSILLHMSKGEISKLIAWASNGIYSHAAIVLDDKMIAEAAAEGVRLYALDTRLAESEHYCWIDAYVPAHALDPGDWNEVVKTARRYLGSPYPLNDLLLLGLVCAARDKIPLGGWARWLFAEAMDIAVDADPKTQVCSEFVFRCFADAATSPPGKLAPRINVSSRPDLAFPHIDWIALYQEYQQACTNAKRSPKPKPDSLQGVTVDRAGTEPVGTDTQRDELLALAAKVRLRHGIRALTESAAIRSTAIEDPMPNPKLITPADLADSPSFAKSARILSA